MSGEGTPPLTILIQGGIASGKSTIARLLAEQGATFVDCDRLAHEELERDAVRAQLRDEFGPAVLDADGHVDRKALGDVVFEDPAALKRLEGLIHPRVATRVQQVLEAHRAPSGERRRVVVVDAAVAEKMALTDRYDIKVFVASSPEVRRRRAETIRGWKPGELERREARQEPPGAKERRADYVIRNDGDLEEAEGHVKRFWSDVVEPRRQG